MTHSTPAPDIAVLKVAASLAAAALFATLVVAMLLGAGALRASPTRFAVVALAAFTFVNWLVRLRTEIGRRSFDGTSPTET
jgi:uncharacterized membrane protein